MAVVSTPNPSNPSALVPVFPHAALAITPADADTFAAPVAVYVGGTGDVAVTPANGGANVTFVGVPAGAMLPVMVRAVLSTGTTATSLVAVY